MRRHSAEHIKGIPTADFSTCSGDAVVPELSVHGLEITLEPLCPQCITGIPFGCAVCPRCDFVVDTSILGDGILDDLAHLRLRSAEEADDTVGNDNDVLLSSSLLSADDCDVVILDDRLARDPETDPADKDNETTVDSRLIRRPPSKRPSPSRPTAAAPVRLPTPEEAAAQAALEATAPYAPLPPLMPQTPTLVIRHPPADVRRRPPVHERLPRPPSHHAIAMNDVTQRIATSDGHSDAR